MKTLGVIAYVLLGLGSIGFLVYWEVWWRTPEAQRKRLQAKVKRQCRKMEDTKRKITQMPLPPSTAPNRIPDPIIRGGK